MQGYWFHRKRGASHSFGIAERDQVNRPAQCQKCGTHPRKRQILLVPILWVFGIMLVSVAGCRTVTPEMLADIAREQSTTVTEIPTVEPVGPEGAVRPEGLPLANGTVISYTVVLPADYISGQSYPTLLALPPGSQTQSMVDAGLDSYWRAGALANGWVVISPVAPGDQLFFQGSEQHLPEFLTQIAARYPPEGDKFHLSGVSNGGISAFRIAGTNPEFFHSLIALPGYPQSEEDRSNLERLADIPVALFVGENDAGWIGPMRETVSMINNRGGNASLEILAGEGHFIRGLIGGEELFDLLEGLRTP